MSTVAPIAFFDSAKVIDTSSTNIPGSGSAPLEVIADSGIHTGTGFSFKDTTGDMIGVYVGAVGVETLACVIGNGLSGIEWAPFPPHTRVSLRSMSTSTITEGFLAGNLVTS